MEKSAGIALEFKSIETSKRTAVIKHACYGSIDKTGDITHKGSFTKSWNETTPKFCLNHELKQRLGSVTGTSEDNEGAYTHVKFGTWSLGNDALEMAEQGIFDGASFMYEVKKKDYTEVKGRKIRNLREVSHIETSLLTIEPAHDGAGIVSLIKSLEIKSLTGDEKALLQTLLSNDISNMQSLINVAANLDVNSDLYTWVMYQISRRADWADSTMSKLYWDAQQVNSMKAHVAKIETFCRKANISDEANISLQNSIQEYKQIISEFDTALTSLATKPGASDDEVKTILQRIQIALAV